MAIAIAVSTVLSACQSSPGVVHDQHTGNSVAYSERIAISSGLLSNGSARAVHSTRAGYGIMTEFMGTGLGWMFFREAWSYGRQFHYEVGDQKVLSCSAGCTLLETGLIRMSDQDFQNAARAGFAFKLVGQNGSIEGKLPSSAFQQVLSQINGD